MEVMRLMNERGRLEVVEDGIEGHGTYVDLA